MNQIPKLRGALELADQLITAGRNINDDGEFGYALTRANIYEFRRLSNPTDAELEAAIAVERLKPSSSQGPRTCARELRKTLVYLGFLEKGVGDEYNISPIGQQLLGLPDPPDVEATDIWRNAVMNIVLAGIDGETEDIHPALNMLRMIAGVPNIDKQWLAFALEMTNDSDEELTRALSYRHVPFDQALLAVGAGISKARDGVKILPALLTQLNLIIIRRGICTITPNGTALLAVPPTPVGAPPAPVGAPPAPVDAPLAPPRETHQGRVIDAPDDIPEHGASVGQTRTTEEQLQTAALLNERTTQHQELVKRIVELLRDSGQVEEIRVSENAFDIVATIPARGEVFLIEAKTIRNDALAQSRTALGQILFYEYFDVHNMAEGYTIKRVVAFNDEPGDQAREFLDAYGTSCLVVSPEQIIAPDGYEDYFNSAN